MEAPLLVTHISPPLQAPTDLGQRSPRIELCMLMLNVLSPPNIYCDSVGSQCKILENLNYGNEMEEIILDYEALNNMPVKSAVHKKVKQEGEVD
jgi:hypothetical protein